MQIKLSDRLRAIAEHVEKDETVADIGTDHGYIPIWLMKNGRCRSVILSDINQGPLDKAAENMKKHLPGIEPDLRLGSGVETLGIGEADTVIIAGMGGMLIESILQREPEKTDSFKRLVLQPRNNSPRLRRRLKELSGFTIVCEQVVKEAGRFCEIITLINNGSMRDEDAQRIRSAELAARTIGADESVYEEFPKLYLTEKSGIYTEYVQYKIKTKLNIICKIEGNGRSESASVRLKEEKLRLRSFEMILKALCS